MSRDYGRRIEFGLSIVPATADLDTSRALARRADALGLDLIGVQDHPYQWRFVETWMLMATLLAETEQIRVFPDVANLPLRLPTLIAKQAASLDVLSGGRFELGLGAGAFWDAIRAMGGPVRSPREALEALEEAIRIIRVFWSGERTLRFEGRYYSVQGLHPGPPPAHPIEIWLGVGKPRALELTGRLADGWVPSFSWAPPQAIPELAARVDAGAAEAGRDPAAVRRVYNVGGVIIDGPARGMLQGPPQHWIDALSEFALDHGLDTFVFWPSEEPGEQLERFAADVVPGVRETVERDRARRSAHF